MRVEVDVVGFLSLTVCTVSVDVNQRVPEMFVDSSQAVCAPFCFRL